jgi:hypothetical protein
MNGYKVLPPKSNLGENYVSLPNRIDIWTSNMVRSQTFAQ